MNLDEGREEVTTTFVVDYTEEERVQLLEYAMDNISQDELDDLMMEWATIEMLKNAIKNKT
jgi:hypothetical protein